MTGPLGPDVHGPAGLAPGGSAPVDVIAILAAMQDQIDDLTAAVEAQQRTIDELVRARRAAGPGRPSGGPGPRR
jgi:hypothetical protein